MIFAREVEDPDSLQNLTLNHFSVNVVPPTIDPASYRDHDSSMRTPTLCRGESDLSATSTSWKEYVFFGGERIARRDASTSTVHYYFSDYLHSTDIVSSSNGTIQNESDYYPYGTEMVITSGDTNHFKFTGKERDSETGLDYFGARYYSSAFGHFMVPDWAAKPTDVPYANFGNPQSLNLYSYVENNPTTLGDPDGHCGEAGSSAGNQNANCDQDWLAQHAPKVAAALADAQQAWTGSIGTLGAAEGKLTSALAQKGKAATQTVANHVFVKVSSGVGLGGEAKIGPVKVEAEAAVKSEGEYTLSGKATNTVVHEAHVSGKIGKAGITLGHTSEDTLHFDSLSAKTPSGPMEHVDHPFVELTGPKGSTASSEGTFSFEAGACLGFCLGVGVGVQ